MMAPHVQTREHRPSFHGFTPTTLLWLPDRGAFICQSQSLNVHLQAPTADQLTSMYLSISMVGSAASRLVCTVFARAPQHRRSNSYSTTLLLRKSSNILVRSWVQSEVHDQQDGALRRDAGCTGMQAAQEHGLRGGVHCAGMRAVQRRTLCGDAGTLMPAVLEPCVQLFFAYLYSTTSSMSNTISPTFKKNRARFECQ
jgi:hypothetical protein